MLSAIMVPAGATGELDGAAVGCSRRVAGPAPAFRAPKRIAPPMAPDLGVREPSSRLPSTPHAQDGASWLQIAIWAALMALGIFLSLRAYHAFQVGIFDDDACYALLARSLVDGRGFGMINAPGAEPLPSPYPFGYPLTLAPLVLLAPADLDVLRLPSLLATVANGALLFWGWRWFSRRSRWWGLAVAGLYVLSPAVVPYSVTVMSEAPFTTLCLVAMLLTEQLAGGKPILWRALLLGAVSAYAICTRSAGVVLGLALAAYLLWRLRRAGWRAIGLAAAGGLVLTACLLLLAPVKPADLLPSRYLTESNNSVYLLARRIGPMTGAANQADPPMPNLDAEDSASPLVLARASRHLTTGLKAALLPGGGGESEQRLVARLDMPWLGTAVSLAILSLVILGWSVWWVRDGMTAFGWFGMIYFGASLLWDWTGSRILYPVAPPLMLCLLIGFDEATRVVRTAAGLGLSKARHSGARTAAAPPVRALTVGVAVLLGCLSVYGSFQLSGYRLHVGDLLARTSWLRTNAPASAVVMSERPATDYLYGSRSTVSQPKTIGSAAELEDYLTAERVDYVLVGPAIGWQASYAPAYSRSTTRLLPLLTELQAAGRLTEVYASAGDRIAVFRSEPP